MSRNRLLLIFLAALLCPGYSHAQAASGLVDPARASNWQNAGSSVNSSSFTQCGATIAAYSGSWDKINNAIAGCSPSTFVLLGPGTFSLNSSGSTSAGGRIRVPGVELRGSGADQTSLVIGSGASDGCGGYIGAICIQSPSATGNYPNDGTTVSWTAGYAQGSTVITLSSVAGITAGVSEVWLSQCTMANSGNPCTSTGEVDNGNFFNCDIGWNGTNGCAVNGPDTGNQQLNRSQAEIFLVTAVNSGANQVTLDGGLVNPNWNSARTPTATIITPLAGSGIANLTLDTSTHSSNAAITLYWTRNCWVHGVRMLNIPYAGIWTILGAHDTFEQNYTYGSTITPGQDNYAYNITSGAFNLIQNNIIQRENGSVFMEGSDTGSVLGYNFSIMDYNGNNTGLNPAYFPHAGDQYELFEGNIANSYFGENFHGPKIANTVFRNLFTGWESGANWPTPVVKDSGTTPVRLMHHSRYHNIVANVLGTPGIATSYSTTSAGFGTGFIYEIGTGDVAPNDPIVGTTRYFWANWDIVSNATRFCGSASNTGWSSTCGNASEVPTGIGLLAQPLPTKGDTSVGQGALPPSLYLTARPSWFRSVPFPAIGPDVSSGVLGVCGGALNTAGHYSGVPATSNANCSPGPALTQAWAGHANPNPALDCFLNVMGGKPDGTNSSVLTFNASVCYGSSKGSPTGPAPATGLVGTGH